jgi:hypothetical protein
MHRSETAKKRVSGFKFKVSGSFEPQKLSPGGTFGLESGNLKTETGVLISPA